MLLSKSEVVEGYLRRAPDQATIGFDLLKHQPPLLCKKILLKEKLDCTTWSPYTGFSSPPKSRVQFGKSDLFVITSIDIQDLIKDIPLDGHYGLTNMPDYALDFTKKAALLFQNLEDSSYAEKIEDWTSLIVWLECDTSSGHTSLTSSTFPLLPHCTFVTAKALRHIPPLNIHDSNSIYCLAENIYHEALHQELSSTFLMSDYINPDYNAESCERIAVPWRGQSWQPDRIVHAAYVYLHLVTLRKLAIHKEFDDTDFLKRAFSGACGALSYLSSRLEDCEPLFSSEGRALLELIQHRAADALETCK